MSDSTLQHATPPARQAPQKPLTQDVPRPQYLAARKVCRDHAPSLFFASHQLSRPRRFAVFALHAVVKQLADIMGCPQVGGAGSCNTAGAGGCGEGGCDGESIDQRRNVCFAVIDHLEQGLETGKPDLDAFLAARQTFSLPRPELELFVKGLATELSTARFATWKRVRRTFDDGAGSLAVLFARLLTDGSAEHDADVNRAAFEQQARAAGIAFRMMHAVASLRDDWRAGRLLLPLDDLVRAKVKLSELPTFASDGTVGANERWAALMAHQASRIADLLRGAARGLSSLEDAGGRRFAAALLVFESDRFTRLLAADGDPFATQVSTSTWRRMTLMRRAHRLAVDPSSVDSLFRDWPL